MAQNIDTFNQGAALILAALYREFPVPASIALRKLEAEQPQGDTVDAEEKRIEIYHATMSFLEAEGYLRHATVSADTFHDVVLTSKGLAALSRVPDALNAKSDRTVGDIMLTASKDILKASAQEAARQAIRVVLGG